MRKAAFLLALLTTFFGGIGAVQAQHKTFSNGGFESGNLQSWCICNKEQPGVKIISSPRSIHSGEYAVELNSGALYQDFFLKQGSEVVISQFTKHEYGSTSNVEVDYITGTNSKPKVITSSPVPTNNGYQITTLSFTAKQPGRYRLINSIGEKGGRFLIDDVRVEIQNKKSNR